jgi:putative ABC transport system permease protein
MFYSLKTLWFERQRYLPGALAVSFSAVLIALQSGLLLGLFAITSIPIDHSRAHIWVAAPKVLSVDLGRPIPEGRLTARLAGQPEVLHTESYLQGFMYWSKPHGGSELCIVVGCSLEDGSIGSIRELTPELRDRLTEPGSVVVDRSELDRLGIQGINDVAEVTGRRVRVVGLVDGMKSLSGPYVFCSAATARPLLRMQPDQTTYVLAQCRDRAAAADVIERLRAHADMEIFASEEFSIRSRLHWLLKTKAGVAMGLSAALGLLVGLVVTTQTLYSATVASLREFAVLRALGIPRWRMAGVVLLQAFWVGAIGILIAAVAIVGAAHGAGYLQVPVRLTSWLWAGTVSLTLSMALLSGLAALRSLRLIEPMVLLR